MSGLQHRHTLASARSIHCPYMTEASLEKREVSLSLLASPPQFDLYSLGIHRPDLLPRASLEALLQNPHPAPLSKKRESVVEQGARKLLGEPGAHVLPLDHVQDDVLAILGGNDRLEGWPG